MSAREDLREKLSFTIRRASKLPRPEPTPTSERERPRVGPTQGGQTRVGVEGRPDPGPDRRPDISAPCIPGFSYDMFGGQHIPMEFLRPALPGLAGRLLSEDVNG